MARLVIFIIFLILFGAVLGHWIAKDVGYILISFHNFTLETSLWMGIIVAVLCLSFVWIVYRLTKGMIFLPRHIRGRILLNKGKKSHLVLRLSLLQIAAGSYNSAYPTIKKLSAGKWGSQTTIEGLVLEAEICLQNQDHKKMIEVTKQIRIKAAKGNSKEEYLYAEKAADILLARSYMQEGKYKQALNLLSTYKSYAKREPFIAKILRELYKNLSQWEDMGYLLASTNLSGDLDKETRDDLLLCFRSINNLDAIKKLWGVVSNNIKEQKGIIAVYALACYRYGDKNYAEKMLRKELSKKCEAALLNAYRLIKAEHPLHQLRFLEELHGQTKQQGHEKEVLLEALAELSITNGLAPKAKGYYEDMLKINPKIDGKIKLKYAKLLERSDNSAEKSKAAAMFRAAAMELNKSYSMDK